MIFLNTTIQLYISNVYVLANKSDVFMSEVSYLNKLLKSFRRRIYYLKKFCFNIYRKILYKYIKIEENKWCVDVTRGLMTMKGIWKILEMSDVVINKEFRDSLKYFCYKSFHCQSWWFT